MTISSNLTRSGPYAGNGVATSFAYGFKIFADADLLVVHTSGVLVETELVLGVDYTVSGAGDDSGGSVTYPLSGSPLPSDEKITIISNISIEQQTDLSNQGGFFPEVHEEVFDRLCRFAQQLNELLSRVLVVPVSSDTLPEDLIDDLIAAESAAAASAAAAAASYDEFDDRYLGAKASDPTLDNDGNALTTGALFFNTTVDQMKVYSSGSTWDLMYEGFDDLYLGPKAAAPSTDNDGDSLSAGMLYFNTTTEDLWVYTGSAWQLYNASAATSANGVSIADSGGFYAGTDVEAALAELRPQSGSWSPTLEGSSVAGTGWVYTVQNGGYAIVGNLMFLSGRIVASTVGAGAAGDILIGNLPATLLNISNDFELGILQVIAGLTITSNHGTFVEAYGTSALRLNEKQIGADIDTPLNISDISGNPYIEFSILVKIAP